MDNFTESERQGIKEDLCRQARLLGVDAIGFAPALPPPRHEALIPWLAQGKQANMAWLARRPERRQDPRCQLAELATVVTLGINCRPPGESLDYLADPGRLGLACYARHGDYHVILAEKARRLMEWLTGRVGCSLSHRIFVDGGAVMEKPLAVAAGLGWQGKHALLVNRRHGCWLLLAEILLPLALPTDTPSRDHCGECTRCQKACPTQALAEPYRLDAGLCLAYHTVENRGTIPRFLRVAMGNRVFGCDDCLVACPWNRFAPPCREPQLLPRPDLTTPMLVDFVEISEEGFAMMFHGHPLARCGVVGFLRNVAVALGNWHHEASLAALTKLIKHPSALVREHAAWGLGNLRQRGFSQAEVVLRHHCFLEQNAAVRGEIDWGLGDV